MLAETAGGQDCGAGSAAADAAEGGVAHNAEREAASADVNPTIH
jgi:hypothetical protein